MDVEKGPVVVGTGSATSETYDTVPGKHGYHEQRWLYHRALILYR